MNTEINPIDLKDLENHCSNIYEAAMIISKRARQLNDEYKQEFSVFMNMMPPTTEDEFEEKGNPDLLKASLEFEKRPKPGIEALQELTEGKLEFRYKDPEEK